MKHHQRNHHLNKWARIAAAVLVLSAVLLFVGCSPDADEAKHSGAAGVIERVIGQVELEFEGQRTGLAAGDHLPVGGTVFTGPKSTVIAILKGGQAEVEIQENAEFHLKQLAEAANELHLRQGNLWVRVNTLSARERFHVHTPTAIAGIRGTKFYAFHMKDPRGRDIHGTCHCEGDVHYDTHANDYEAVHSDDYLVLTREGKTILMTPDELDFLGPDMSGHRHSHVTDSPLGPAEQALTPEQMKIFMERVERKFAES